MQTESDFLSASNFEPGSLGLANSAMPLKGDHFMKNNCQPKFKMATDKISPQKTNFDFWIFFRIKPTFKGCRDN